MLQTQTYFFLAYESREIPEQNPHFTADASPAQIHQQEVFSVPLQLRSQSPGTFLGCTFDRFHSSQQTSCFSTKLKCLEKNEYLTILDTHKMFENMVTTDNQLKIKFDCTIILCIVFSFYTPLSAIPLCTLSPSSPSSHIHQSPLSSVLLKEFSLLKGSFSLPPWISSYLLTVILLVRNAIFIYK